jgi:hypothetical protein
VGRLGWALYALALAASIIALVVVMVRADG